MKKTADPVTAAFNRYTAANERVWKMHAKSAADYKSVKAWRTAVRRVMNARESALVEWSRLVKESQGKKRSQP